jgi:carboxyl-terminal processing protease
VLAAGVLFSLAFVSIAVAGTVESACELIYNGKFDQADELIKKSESQPATAELSKIIAEYKQIRDQRQSAWEDEYEKKMSRLEKFQTGQDSNDINDANGIAAAFSAIVGVRVYANEQQRKELLADAFVRGVVIKALGRAEELEAQGKWLESLTRCYRWLEAIEPDNKAYSDYSEELLARIRLVESFKDSPCETRKQRYERVEPEMLFKALDVLSFNYVNPMDYRQMAIKAVKRCKLLAEVLKYSAIDPNKLDYQISDSQMAAWSAGLSVMLEEIKESPTGLSKDKFKSILKRVIVLNNSCVKPLMAMAKVGQEDMLSSDEKSETRSDRDTLLPSAMLIAQFTQASLSALDPYTIMIWPKGVEDFEKQMTNEFTGIGIEISKPKGQLTVGSLFLDTPAYYSGLDAGDIIEAVDGIATKDMPLGCAVKNITGPAGTQVTLTVKRPGQEKIRKFTITRARIVVPTIRGWKRNEAGNWLYMVDDSAKIAYVRVTSFSERTTADLEKVLKQLEAEGLAKGGLIIDLRFNPGGLLTAATEISDMFLKSELIVRTQPRFGIPTYASAHKRGTHPDYPIVVLINSYSASASEIVAGALADKVHNRATLVGERTHGKGSVQGITSYPGGGAQLKYTMAYYHLPSGQRVETRDAMKKLGRKDWGVGPDVKVKLKNNELKKFVDVQRANDILVRVDHDQAGVPLKKHTIEETLKADRQFAIATLVMRAKIVEQKAKGEK